ncbi:MAG: DNA/RNA nuclease SfsA [Bacillota bacterium]
MVCQVALPPDLEEAFFIRRLNRFAAEVTVRGSRELAHVPSSGRMAELLVPSRRVWVSRYRRGHCQAGLPKGGQAGTRKTACRLLLAEHRGILVSVDATLPNKLVARALRAGALAALAHYETIRAEYSPGHSKGHSRFDFLLSAPPGHRPQRCLLEVKSVTLVEAGVALFPDAPSSRGTKHLEELRAARAEEMAAAVLFVAQREDASCFTPHRRQDPAFAGALERAAANGVQVLACRCRVTLDAVTLEEEIPVSF